MKNKILILTLFFSISCQDNSTQTLENEVLSETPSETPSELNNSDDSCPQGFACEDKCTELFNRRDDQQKCMNLSISEINGLHTALTNRLKTPVGSFDLQLITDSDFENISNIGSRNWSQNMQDYTEQDSQRVLDWLVRNRAYTRILNSNQDARGVFPELIEKIGTPLSQSLDFLATTGQNIILTAERIGNDDALELIHDSFVSQCSHSRYSRFSLDFQRSACVLGDLYCQNGGQKFQEVYPDLLRIDTKLHSFIVYQNGLDLSENFRDFELVCRTLCSRANC